jgi:micrococcal nuclease
MFRRFIKSHLIAFFWIPWAITLALIYDNDNYCTRVIDGDTIVVEIGGQEEKVRLIGVDTPETVNPKKPVEYFGKEASEFTRKMVEGRQVRLEYDWQTRDKYGRLLAYVYLENGTFLNAEIIKQGYGFAYTRFPFKHLDDFRQYERDARENNRGLWSRGAD